MEYTIHSEDTAISNGQSNGTKMLCNDLAPNDLILDYGCGLLRNAKFIKERTNKIEIADIPVQIERMKEKTKDFEEIYPIGIRNIPKRHYDKILCSFVLNVMENKEDRVNCLITLYNALKKDGILYLEVRGNQFVKQLKYYEQYKDGYLIGKNKKRTFQKPYTTPMLMEFIEEIKEIQFTIVEKSQKSDAITLKLKKETRKEN